jgi:predicted GNAT family acetyltransferase
MRVHATADVEEYAAAAASFLKEEPCARNVLLTIMDVVRTAAPTFSAPPTFWWVTDAENVVGAASWTPPRSLLVSSMPSEAAPGLVASALDRANALGIPLPGFVGPASAARSVAAVWTAVTGDTVLRDRSILLNELGSLTEVARPPGARRAADARDIGVVAAWLAAFSDEIEHAPMETLEIAGLMVEAGQIDLWIDGGTTVCMAGHRVAAGVARVGPVYTPPAHRYHGYARRLTYEVTAAAMARPDVHHAMLFTDADNPVSNSIYRQAGYEPRDEHVEIDIRRRDLAPGH